jgi:hypothetical protein
MRYTINNHHPNQYTIQPVRSTIKSREWHPSKDKGMKFDPVICEYERRAEDRAKKKQHQQCNIITNNNNNNQYNILQDDTF